MISQRIRALRAEHKMSQKELAEKLFVSPQAVSKWERDEATPNPEAIIHMAEIFGVTADDLLGRDINETAPTLTKKDERDIARDLEAFIADMDQGDLMFDGDPMTPEARESVIAAMKLGLEAAKMKNKERFTPKKYRKDTPDK